MQKILLALIILVGVGGILFLLMSNGADTNPDANSVPSDLTEVETTSEQPTMSFFVTSKNPGTGANLGGLAGADALCQSLATDAGAGDKTWRAYLSAAATDTQVAVDARDRIGTGPWYNFAGALIATSVTDLHSSENMIDKEKGLTEVGGVVNGRGDSPNVHDILTGSNADGTLALAEDSGDTTCSNWTSEAADGSAVVGHHDRMGPDTLETAASWNAAHGSRGCSLENLNSTGGGGLLYCFAI